MRTRQPGFSLVEMAMVLAISGLMLGFVLQANQSSAPDCYAATRQQMQAIRTAIESFARKNDRLPMPAARALGVENINYGQEGTALNTTTAGTSSWGALPFKALGLSQNFGADCWGNKFTYVVTTALTTNATSGGYLDYSAVGTITLESSTSTVVNTNTAYAIISHGLDALGAVKANATTASWCTTTSSTLKYINCAATSATVADAVFNDGKDGGSNYYDDLIIAAAKPQIIRLSNIVCWGGNSGEGGLGDGTFNDRNNPLPVSGGKQYASLWGNPQVTYNSGTSFCGIKPDGTTDCWGMNNAGQLGTMPNPTAIPTPYAAGYTWSYVSGNVDPSFGGSNGYMCAIAGTGGLGIPGRIYCMGWGDSSGTFGDGESYTSHNTPVLITAPGDPSFSKVYTVGDHSCGLTTTGAAYCWGGNWQGQLGDGTFANQATPVAVAGGYAFTKLILYRSFDNGNAVGTCGVSTTNHVYCWGGNAGAMLGTGTHGGGSGMTSAPTVTFSGGGGSGATAAAVLDSHGGIDYVTVTNPGSGYTSAPTVTFSGGGTSPNYPSVGAYIDSGYVNGVGLYAPVGVPTEIAGGHLYTDVTYTQNTSSGPPSVCALEVSGDLYCWGNIQYSGDGGAGNGCAGNGFTSAPSVLVIGSGSGATATSTLNGDCVNTITVTGGGSSYSDIYTHFILYGGGGNLVGSITPLAPYGYPGVVREGPATSVSITSGGSGYTSAPTLNFSYYGPSGTTTLTGDAVTSATITSSPIYDCDGYGGCPSAYFTGGGGTGAAGDVVVSAPLKLQGYYVPVARENGSYAAPHLVAGGIKFQQITGGGGYYGTGFCALSTANQLYCWGWNYGGDKGTGGSSPNQPTLLNTFTKNTANDTTGLTFKKLIPSEAFWPCAITTTDELYCWGSGIWPVPTAVCPGGGGANCSYKFYDVKNGYYDKCGITCRADGVSSAGDATSCCNGDPNTDGICGP